jgi:hypothetical protein
MRHLWSSVVLDAGGGGICVEVSRCGGGERDIGGLVYGRREMWVPHLK